MGLGLGPIQDYSSLDKAKQATSGLCFDAEGTAYTLKFVNELNREVFEHLSRIQRICLPTPGGEQHLQWAL